MHLRQKRQKKREMGKKEKKKRKKESSFPGPNRTLILTLSPNHLANELFRRTRPTVQSNILYRHDIL